MRMLVVIRKMSSAIVLCFYPLRLVQIDMWFQIHCIHDWTHDVCRALIGQIVRFKYGTDRLRSEFIFSRTSSTHYLAQK